MRIFMATGNRTVLYGIVVLLIALVIISASVAAYFYYLYSQESAKNATLASDLRSANTHVVTNVVIDFGNGTKLWYNDTRVDPTWNLYIVTQVVTKGNLNATWYPAYGEHFITAIYGVGDTSSKSWFEWNWSSSAGWQNPSVGPDLIPIANNSVFAWTFCGENSNYAPTCTPP
jgi:hypothetical protein